MSKKVLAKVISQRGQCQVGHRVGDSVIFREEGVEGKICLHALYSMVPKAYAMYYEARFPWLKEGEKAVHACPDPNNPVVFELEVVDES